MKFDTFLKKKIHPEEFISQVNIISGCDFLFASQYFVHENKKHFGITPDTKIITKAPDADSVIMCRFKDGEVLDLIESCRENFQYYYVIVQTLIGDDGFITDDVIADLPENILAIYSKNTYFRDPKLIAIPIGRDWRNTSENNIHTYIKKYSDVYKKMAYLNFSIDTNQLIRSYVFNKFKDQPWVTQRKPEKYGNYDLTHTDYLEEMSKHLFAFSPVGRAMDCYRTWDALYAKCIPIVDLNVHTSNWNDLPVILVQNWKDINKDHLEEYYMDVRKKEIPFDKMTGNYWKKMIKDSLNGRSG